MLYLYIQIFCKLKIQVTHISVVIWDQIKVVSSNYQLLENFFLYWPTLTHTYPTHDSTCIVANVSDWKLFNFLCQHYILWWYKFGPIFRTSISWGHVQEQLCWDMSDVWKSDAVLGTLSVHELGHIFGMCYDDGRCSHISTAVMTNVDAHALHQVPASCVMEAVVQ